MANKYRHKKTGIEVTWSPGSQRYFSVTNTNSYYIPKEVVEGSTEWEEILPLTDFYGVEVDVAELHYRVVVDKAGNSTVLNGKDGILPNFVVEKVIAIFKEYNQACQFQRIFVSLRKDKDLLTTLGGNPTTYLKNLLKTL